MIVDFHIHPLVNVNRIVSEMDKAGVSRGVILATDLVDSVLHNKKIMSKMEERFYSSLTLLCTPGIWQAIFGRGLSIFEFSVRKVFEKFFNDLRLAYPEARITNREVWEIVRQHPDRFIGFGSVNVNRSAREIERELQEIKKYGFKGIKMLPTLQFFNPIENKNFRKVCEFCEREKKILLYHTGCDPGPFEIPELSEDANPCHLEPILDEYEFPIVLAHMGSYSMISPGIWFYEALRLMKKYDYVYADISAVTGFLLQERIIKRIREAIGMERVLFGSDFPVVFASTISSEVEMVRRNPYLTEEEKEQILGLNAKELLRL
ncbi:MAG: amidohydrolase family protein [Candidatus Baldrarchaeia archaeon]